METNNLSSFPFYNFTDLEAFSGTKQYCGSGLILLHLCFFYHLSRKIYIFQSNLIPGITFFEEVHVQNVYNYQKLLLQVKKWSYLYHFETSFTSYTLDISIINRHLATVSFFFICNPQFHFLRQGTIKMKLKHFLTRFYMDIFLLWHWPLT